MIAVERQMIVDISVGQFVGIAVVAEEMWSWPLAVVD